MSSALADLSEAMADKELNFGSPVRRFESFRPSPTDLTKGSTQPPSGAFGIFVDLSVLSCERGAAVVAVAGVEPCAPAALNAVA